MTDDARLTVAERMKEARLHTGVRQMRTVTMEAMAELVAAVIKRPLHLTQWRRYENGESEPPLDVIVATAKVSGLAEAYIAFGGPAAGQDEPSWKRAAREHGGTIAQGSTELPGTKAAPAKKVAGAGKRPKGKR